MKKLDDIWTSVHLPIAIYCCGCKEDVMAGLVPGTTTYPHLISLHNVPFWRCYQCKNFVGCHYKSKDTLKPLGVIPTKELKLARQFIHARLDPLWKKGLITRAGIYSEISTRIGYDYHTAEIREIEEARKIYRIIKEIEKSILGHC